MTTGFPYNSNGALRIVVETPTFQKQAEKSGRKMSDWLSSTGSQPTRWQVMLFRVQMVRAKCAGRVPGPASRAVQG